MNAWSLEDGPWKLDGGAIFFQAGNPGFPALACWRKAIPPDFDLRFEWKESASSKQSLQGHFQIGTHGAMTENGWAGSFWCSYWAGGRSISIRTDEVSIPIKFAGISGGKAPSKDVSRPAGQWNQARMVCKGSLFQHWLNGEKILEIDLRQGNWLKLKKEPENPLLDEWFKVRKKGFRLEIENADTPAWFRNIKAAQSPRTKRLPMQKAIESRAGPKSGRKRGRPEKGGRKRGHH